MERTQKLINSLRKADKLFNGSTEQKKKADFILKWLDDNVTARDLDKMSTEDYHLFECYELGYDSDCNYHEGWD